MDVFAVARRRARTRRSAGVAVVVLAALGLSASVSAGPHATSPPAKPAGNQSLVVRQVVPQALDPAFFANNNNYTLIDNLYEPLVRTTRGGRTLLPGLALSWSSSQGDKVWTFNLRKNARFSDGSRITAADVKYTLVRDFTPVTPEQMQALGATSNFPQGFIIIPELLGASAVRNGTAQAIPASAITASGKWTVKITLEVGRTDLPQRMAWPALGIVKATNVAQSSAGSPWWYNPVSSGPFKVTNFVANTSVTLAPNSYYYGDKPKLKQVTFQVVTDTQTAEIAFEAHNLDVVKTIYSDVSNLKNHGFKDDLFGYSDRPESVILATPNIPPTDDMHVLRALAMAIDKKTLANTVLEGLVLPARTFTPPNYPGYSAKGFKPFEFDPAAARAELAQSKYKASDITIRFSYTGSQDPRAAQAIAQMWQQNLGIKVQLMTTSPPAQAPADQALNVLLQAQGPTFVAPCSMVQRWPDFVTFAKGANNVNFAGISPPGLDPAMNACYSAKGGDVWKQVINVENLMQQYPQFIPVLYNQSYYLVQPWVKNMLFGPNWNIANLSKVWIAQH
jgi:ABC-type transport system substrate-binding protein